MERLFIAIDLPSPLRQRLFSLTEALKNQRRVPEPQLHLTLCFVGETTDEKAVALEEALLSVQHPVFEICLFGMSTFGRPPRVLHTGISPEDDVRVLAASVTDTVASIVPEAIESRPFSPHITLARLKAMPPTQLRTLLEGHGEFRTEPFEVKAFQLFVSTLSSSGAVHRVRRQYDLSGKLDRD